MRALFGMMFFIGSLLALFPHPFSKGIKISRRVAAVPRALPADVTKTIQTHCTSCHAQFNSESEIVAAGAKIVQRISWMKTSPFSPPRGAMPQGDEQQEQFRTVSPETIDKMISTLSAAQNTSRSQSQAGRELKLPPGFSIEKLADVPGARSIALGNEGMIFIGTGGFANPLDRIYLIWDKNKNDAIESSEVRIIADGLENPNGVAFKNDTLYVAEENRILKFSGITALVKTLTREQKLSDRDAKVLADKLPNHGGHSWRYIRFGRGKTAEQLFLSVGAPCNVCLDQGFAAIYSVDVVSGKMEIYAEGVRNTVGFDAHPVTGDLWFTDNGRDSLGDNFPPDELNVATKKGQHFGFPFCHGPRSETNRDRDPEFGKNADCSRYTPPAVALAPHGAALGMRFYTGAQFPPSYKHRIFIAEHGSWNRTTYSGHRVSMSGIDSTGKTFYLPFIEGWVRPDNTRWGRPVDVEVLASGDVLVSDDGIPGSENEGSLYRVRYAHKKP